MALKLGGKKNNTDSNYQMNGGANQGMPNGAPTVNGVPMGGGMPNEPNGPKGKGPKVKKEKLKNVSNTSKRRNVILGCLGLIAVVLGMNVLTSYQARQVVEVAALVSAVPQDGLIRVENIVPYTMSKDEYMKRGIDEATGKRSIILYSDRETINNTYASYYIREDSPIFWDAIGAESPKQYSYLYNMDGELLKISMDANTFGQMLVPGDHINVRAAYTEQVYTLPTEEEFLLQQQTGISPQTSVKRQILLFNNVAVLDMLNGNGESIFDKYYELMSLPKNEQLEMVQSEEFIAAVQPAEILLNVTPEEADRYMSIQSSGPSYMMTLLPRTSSNAITEVLNELQVGFARK